MARQRTAPDCYRLKPALVAELTRRDARPKGVNFTQFFRRNGKSGQVERHYPKLVNGEAVPEVIAREFIAFLNQVTKIRCDFHESTVRADPPPNPSFEGDWQSWDAIGERIARPFRDANEMYLDDPDTDIPSIFAAFCANLGLLDDSKLTRGEATWRGETIRGLSVADGAAWLRTLYVWPYRTTLYAVHEGQRVAAMIILPVTEDVFRRMSTGRMRPEEITPAQLPDPADAKYLWIEALAPIGDGFDMPVAERSRAETHVFMYQLAGSGPSIGAAVV
jgi:hypothetical protein